MRGWRRTGTQTPSLSERTTRTGGLCGQTSKHLKQNPNSADYVCNWKQCFGQVFQSCVLCSQCVYFMFIFGVFHVPTVATLCSYCGFFMSSFWLFCVHILSIPCLHYDYFVFIFWVFLHCGNFMFIFWVFHFPCCGYFVCILWIFHVPTVGGYFVLIFWVFCTCRFEPQCDHYMFIFVCCLLRGSDSQLKGLVWCFQILRLYGLLYSRCRGALRVQTQVMQRSTVGRIGLYYGNALQLLLHMALT